MEPSGPIDYVMGTIGVLAGICGLWGALLLLFHAGAWFNRRDRLRPKPSSTPGLVALFVGTGFVPAEFYLVIRSMSYGVGMLQQLVLLAIVVWAWRWLARAERSWPLPSSQAGMYGSVPDAKACKGGGT